jgi:hypothetical protein
MEKCENIYCWGSVSSKEADGCRLFVYRGISDCPFRKKFKEDFGAKKEKAKSGFDSIVYRDGCDSYRG